MNEYLKELIQLMNKQGYITRTERDINRDFECQDKVITIFYNSQFKIDLKTATDQLRMETTYSNQTVDQQYINDVNWLYERCLYYNNR